METRSIGKGVGLSGRSAICLALGLSLCPGSVRPVAASDFPRQAWRVPRQEIQRAMETQRDLGYDLTRSTFATRLNTGVILQLVRSAEQERPDGPPLWLHYSDWYEAYRLALGLDSSEVPTFIAIQRTYRQSQFVEYRATQTVYRVKQGPKPLRVVRVTAGWPDTGNAAGEYTFDDTLTSPALRVTNERVVSYWLVEYPDMIFQDRVRGIKGRPLTGALGTLFSVIGSGRAVYSRFAVAADTLLITQSRAQKSIFKVNPTTVTYPDGRMDDKLPAEVPGVQEVVERLKQKLEIEYPADG